MLTYSHLILNIEYHDYLFILIFSNSPYMDFILLLFNYKYQCNWSLSFTNQILEPPNEEEVCLLLEIFGWECFAYIYLNSQTKTICGKIMLNDFIDLILLIKQSFSLGILENWYFYYILFNFYLFINKHLCPWKYLKTNVWCLFHNMQTLFIWRGKSTICSFE